LLVELDGVIDADKVVSVKLVEVIVVSVLVVANTTCNTAPVPSLDVLIAADAEMPELSIVDTAITAPCLLNRPRLLYRNY
jgi:hypothetical protein